MRAGKNRHRLIIEAPPDPTVAGNRDAGGGVVGDWVEVTTVWGSVEDLTGRERWEAEKVEPDVDTRIEIRFVASLHSRHRIRQVYSSVDAWGAGSGSGSGSGYDTTEATFAIRAIIDKTGRRREHELLCKRLV